MNNKTLRKIEYLKNLADPTKNSNANERLAAFNKMNELLGIKEAPKETYVKQPIDYYIPPEFYINIKNINKINIIIGIMKEPPYYLYTGKRKNAFWITSQDYRNTDIKLIFIKEYKTFPFFKDNYYEDEKIKAFIKEDIKHILRNT